MSRPPTVSVIVACHNPGSRLASALGSVWDQQKIDVELVVVDAGSTDGTAAWLEARRDRIAHLVVAPDATGFAALNRGLALARGEWIRFLGPSDRLAGDRILSEVALWMRKSEAGVVAGEAACDDGRILKLRSHPNAVAGNFVDLRSAFYRRSLFAENGDFDAALRFRADYDFHLRLWKGRVRFKPIPLRVAACGLPTPADDRGWSAGREEIAVRHRYFGATRCWFWDLASLARAPFAGPRRRAAA